MTNQERTHWLKLQTAKVEEKNKQQKEEMAKVKNGRKSPPMRR